MTEASFTPNEESQIVPHFPFWLTSTRPSQGPAPLTSRTFVSTIIQSFKYHDSHKIYFGNMINCVLNCRYDQSYFTNYRQNVTMWYDF